MKKFVRQMKSTTAATPDITLDFGAAATKIPHVFEPGDYHLRIESAKVIQPNGNVLIVLDLIEVESGQRVDCRPLWVTGPNADAGYLAAENQHLIAQLLTLADLPTKGNVGDLIEKLAGLKFDAHLVLGVDKNGRSFNTPAEIYEKVAP